MGLDTSHDCWHGSYIGFGWFRSTLFDVAFGVVPDKADSRHYAYLHEVDSWAEDDERRKDPLLKLLMHSDCDGEIAVEDQLALAARLEELGPKLEALPDERKHYASRAYQFARGLREANAANQAVEFR